MDIALALSAAVALLLGLLMLTAASRLRHVRRRAEELEEKLRRHEGELGALREELEVTRDNLYEAREELKSLALTDPLTGLKNRRYFTETITKEVARIERAYGEMLRERRTPSRPANLGFLLVAIDDLAGINERYGAEAGDELLRKVAVVLRRQFRRTDKMIRWGGEEFLGVCDDIKRSAMQELATRVARAVREIDFAISDTERINATVSAAYSFYPLWETGEDELSHEDVIALMRKALVEARQQGNDVVVGLVKGELPIQAEDVEIVRRDLARAIADGLVRLVSEPGNRPS